MADPVTGTSTENMEGQGLAFTNGYNYTFSADQGEVTISFEALDSYEGLVAYLWNYTSGFAEKQMSVSGQTATITLHSQRSGATLDFACKFAYAGGMSVTKRFQYTVPAYEEQGGEGGGETIYWSDWLGDGAGNGQYSDKYKVQDVDGVSPVNIQIPGFANGNASIYITFPAAITSISGAEGVYDGAGAAIYLSSLTAEYTTVTVECANGQTYTFMIYFVDGTTTTALDNIETTKAIKTIENGQVVILRDGVKYNALGAQL